MIKIYKSDEETVSHVEYKMGVEKFTIVSVKVNNSLDYILENHTADCSSGYYNDTQYMASTNFKTTVYVMYCTIFVTALLGNGMVCVVVQSSARMRTVTNVFIVNLAISDILMSVFCIPFSFVSQLILSYWPFGIVLCHMVNYSQAVSVLVSAYTLVAISIERYLAITDPLKPRLKRSEAKNLVTCVWVGALIVASPIPVVSRLFYPDEWHELCERSICHEGWPTAKSAYAYSLILLVVQFVLPLAMLIYTYARIAVALWGGTPPGEAENERDRRIAKSKRKMVKMMLTVVTVFTLCWLPFNALVVLWKEGWEDLWYLPYLWFTFHWLAMSHSCYNPIIYCYMNATFRIGFMQILRRIPCCRRKVVNRSSIPLHDATALNGLLEGLETREVHFTRMGTWTTSVRSNTSGIESVLKSRLGSATQHPRILHRCSISSHETRNISNTHL